MLVCANIVVSIAQNEFLEPQEFILSNGLKSLLVEDPNSSRISFELKIDVVPVNERDLAGLSEMTGMLLLSGTDTNSKAEIDQTCEILGAHIQTSPDGVYASCPTKNAEELLSLLARIIFKSNFPMEEFEKVKAQTASLLVGSENDLEVISQRVGDVVRYKKGIPYGVLVTKNSIDNIRREHVQAYYDQFFVPANAYLVVVGDLQASKMIGSIQSAFAEWVPNLIDATAVNEKVLSLSNISAVKKHPQPPKENHVVFVDMPATQECVIEVTYPIFLAPKDPEALSADLMNVVLSERLLNVFPEEIIRNDNFDNSVVALRADEYIGSFSAKVMVKNTFADVTVSIILDEMVRMISEKVDKKELKAAKELLAKEFTSSLEDLRTVSELLLDQVLYGLQEDHYRTYLQRLDTISISTIQAMASAYLKPHNAHIIVVGDKEEVANKLSKFADGSSIEYLDKNGDRYREELQMPPAGVGAQEVINEHYMALGGKSKLLARNTEKIVMTTEVDGISAKCTSYRKAPNKYLMMCNVDDTETLKKVYDGAKGVLIEEGRTKDLLDIDLDDLRHESDMNFGMNYPQLSFDLSFVGISNVKGRPANKIRIITEAGIPIEEYFDVETKLMVKRIEIKYTTEGLKKKVTYFDEYKEVDGILYAHTVTEILDQKQVYKIKSITLNEEIKDELFLIP